MPDQHFAPTASQGSRPSDESPREEFRNSTQVSFIPDDHFHDECGVFAIYGHPEAANLTYLGLYALQHRGQESSGIASSDGRELHCHKSMGHVADIFTPEVL